MNEYSSDTKKVAAKLAGMTDACANVHDDERDDIEFVPWHGGECPVPSGHDVSIKFMGGDYVWTSCPEEYRWNHLGNDGDIVGYFDHTEAEREAGLIDVNDTDVVDMQDSQQSIEEVNEPSSDLELPGMWERADFEGGLDESRGKNWKPEPQEQEWVNGLPPVNFECEMQRRSNAGDMPWETVTPKYFGVKVFIYDQDGKEYNGLIGRYKFRPIQPEQKPDERDEAIFEMYRDATGEVFEGNEMDDGVVFEACAALHDAGYRLTKGDGDE